MQRREREWRLDLEPLGAHHPRVADEARDLVDQRRLADARLSPYDQAAGRAVACPFDEVGQDRPFPRPPHQHPANVLPPVRPGRSRTRRIDRADRRPRSSCWRGRAPRSRRPTAGPRDEEAPDATPDRAAAVRRSGGARRRRPLGGAGLLGARVPGGRVDRLLPLRRRPGGHGREGARPRCAPLRGERSPARRAHPPGRHRHPSAPARPGAPGLGTRPARHRAAPGQRVYRQPRLRRRRSALREAGHHPLGVAQPALRARPDGHHRRGRPVRRRR